MKMITTLTCAALMVALPAFAKSYRVSNHLDVAPLSTNVFEVIESNGARQPNIMNACWETIESRS